MRDAGISPRACGAAQSTQLTGAGVDVMATAAGSGQGGVPWEGKQERTSGGMVRDFQPDLLSLSPPRLDGRGSGVAGWRWTGLYVKHTVVLVLRPDGRGGGYAAACAQTPIIKAM